MHNYLVVGFGGLTTSGTGFSLRTGSMLGVPIVDVLTGFLVLALTLSSSSSSSSMLVAMSGVVTMLLSSDGISFSPAVC